MTQSCAGREQEGGRLLSSRRVLPVDTQSISVLAEHRWHSEDALMNRKVCLDQVQGLPLALLPSLWVILAAQ